MCKLFIVQQGIVPLKKTRRGERQISEIMLLYYAMLALFIKRLQRESS